MNNKDYTAVKYGNRNCVRVNPASKASLSDILKRLIIRECEDFLGESGQEPEKQAV